MIEQSFSTMNNVIKKKTNRINIETVNAIQTVKYDLKAKNETTISRYQRTDVLRSPIDRRLCYRVPHSYALYKKNLETLGNARKRKRDEMGSKEVSKTKKMPVHVRAKKLKCTLVLKISNNVLHVKISILCITFFYNPTYHILFDFVDFVGWRKQEIRFNVGFTG